MRLLNSNIVNFGYPIYNTTTGYADASVLFFEAKPDLSKSVYDLTQASVATTNIRLQAVEQGYKYLAESSVGVKAIEGSEYWPEYGITIHHPKIFTQRFIGENDSATFNFAIPSLPMSVYPGGIISHPIPVPSTSVRVASQISYSEDITFDCAFRIQRDTVGALSADLWVHSGGAYSKTVTGSIPANQSTETVTANTGKNFLVHNAVGNTGRLIYAQVGDHTTTPIKKTLAYAVIVFTRYAAGNTATDNVVFGTEVGATGSGAYIELFKTELSTGQYPIITNLRTGIL